MSTTTPSAPTIILPASVLPADWTLADLQDRLGDVPADRIRLFPPPGMATEADLLHLLDHEDRPCELIDGVLVEKTMGYIESILSVEVIFLLKSFLAKHDLGIVLGEGAPQRILPTQVRMPDISFIRWDRFPNRKLPREQILGMAPDLAIEILSPSNSKREMQQKLKDYFSAGVRLVWYIDPATRTATIYTGPQQATTIDQSGKLTGGDVLPGFELSLGELFQEIDKHLPKGT